MRGESPDEELARLRRLAAVEELAPTLFATLDVHALPGRVSDVAKCAVPHDVIRITTWSDDQAQRAEYVSGGADRDDARIVVNRGPSALTDRCDVHIVDDLDAETDRKRWDAPPGLRSLMRLPAYHSADIAIGG